MSKHDNGREVEKHESFGLVSFSRITGGGKRRFFGSPLRDHASSISLTIKKAYREHELSQDWIFEDREVVEVEMTAAQFATLLTTMNYGSGVPCTIRRIEGRRMDDPPEEKIEVDRIRDGFNDDLSALVEKIAKNRRRVDEIIETGNKTKKAMREISSMLASIEQDVRSNLPFVAEQFERATEKIVNVAKAEVDAFVTSVVEKTGLKELKRVALAADEPKQITDGGENEKGS